jgi:hypothetical protein
MRKLFSTPILFVIACVFAGFYGALHNQISYTVCPEYFTKFKFHQFHLAPALHGRHGASLVGVAASWWMGLIIGLFVIPAALFVPSKSAVKVTIKAFGVVAVTALIVGLGALLIASIVVDDKNAGQHTRYGHLIIDNVAFVRAGAMHNFSYLGGLIGIVSGIVYIVSQRLKKISLECVDQDVSSEA